MTDLWDVADRAWRAVREEFNNRPGPEDQDWKKRREGLLETARKATREAEEAVLTPLFKRFRRYARHTDRCSVHIDDSIVCDLTMQELRPSSSKCNCGLDEFLKDYAEALKTIRGRK